MLVLSLIVLTALVVVALLSLAFAARAAARRAEVAREVDAEVVLIQKRAHEADQKLVAAILAGTGVDPAVAQFQKERAALLPAVRSEDAWAWTPDDLDAHRKTQFARRVEEIGRKLLLPAVASVLVVVLVAAGLVVLLYPHTNRRPEPTTETSSQSGAATTTPQELTPESHD